jgi:phosphatidylinositol alpha-mannosyltransferase
VKKWLLDVDFDVLHVHEANAPGVDARADDRGGPIVATFHTSTSKSLTLSIFQGILRPWHEKKSVASRSGPARRCGRGSARSDAVQIPNGVDVDAFASAPTLEGTRGRARCCSSAASTSRARAWTSLRALPALVDAFPDVEVLIGGPR